MAQPVSLWVQGKFNADVTGACGDLTQAKAIFIRSNINIVAGCGLYTADTHPGWVKDASVDDYRKLGVGFRDRYIKDTVEQILNVSFDVNDGDIFAFIGHNGAGKTTTVAAKVRYLVEKKGIDPKQILVISFTNKAVGELKEKINSLEVRKDGIQSRIDNVQEEIDEQNASLHEKTKQLNDIKANILSFEENINISSVQITENDKEVHNLRKQISEYEEERKNLQVL